MRDFHWTEELIEMGCDSFLIKMRQSIIEKDASQMTVPDLEDELYRWSIDGNLLAMTDLSTRREIFSVVNSSFVNLMLYFHLIPST